MKHKKIALLILVGSASSPASACCGWSDGFEGSGELDSVDFAAPEMTLSQDGSASTSVSFGCGTAAGSIEVGAEGLPAGTVLRREGSGDCSASATVTIQTSGTTPSGRHYFVFGARPFGGQWLAVPMSIYVDPGATFRGEFSSYGGTEFPTVIWAISPAGDRCEWYVDWEGSIEIVYTDTHPIMFDQTLNNSFKLSATRTTTPVESPVGTTNCIGSSLDYSKTTMFSSDWPSIEVRIELPLSSGSDVFEFRGGYQANWREMVGRFQYWRVRENGGGSGLISAIEIPRIE